MISSCEEFNKSNYDIQLYHLFTGNYGKTSIIALLVKYHVVIGLAPSRGDPMSDLELVVYAV